MVVVVAVVVAGWVSSEDGCVRYVLHFLLHHHHHLAHHHHYVVCGDVMVYPPDDSPLHPHDISPPDVSLLDDVDDDDVVGVGDVPLVCFLHHCCC